MLLPLDPYRERRDIFGAAVERYYLGELTPKQEVFQEHREFLLPQMSPHCLLRPELLQLRISHCLVKML